MKNFEEKTIKKENIFNGHVLNVEVHDVKLPDGTISKREILKHYGGVGILAVTDNKEILLVEQYRKAVEKTTLEIPAGKLSQGEIPIKCAVRELKEETGYSVLESDLLKIYEIHSAIGYSSELLNIYFVENLSKEKLGSLSLDEGEFLNLRKYSIEEVYELLDKNIITDSKTVIALEWYRNRRS